MRELVKPAGISGKVLHLLVAVLLSAILSSCDESPLSKEVVRKSLMERAEEAKEPLLIESISDVEPMTLHGDKCLTVVAYVKWPQGVSKPIYFVYNRGSYISGGGNLIQEIDEQGYDAVYAKLPEPNSSDSSEAPTSTPSPTPDSWQVRAPLPTRAVATPTPRSAQLDLQDAEEDLNRAWKSFTEKQRSQLREEEQNWGKRKNALPLEDRIKSTQQRAKYLWSFVDRTFDD